MKTSTRNLDAERKLAGVLWILMWPFIALYHGVITGLALACLSALAVARITRWSADLWDHVASRKAS